MLNKQNIKDIYPLSPMQEGMLFHHLVDTNSNAYFEQSSYTVNGNLDVEVFNKSITYLINRHDILRTVFAFKNVSRPFQVVLKQVEFKLNQIDFTQKPENEKNALFEELKQNEFNKPFKLGEDLLLRVTLVKYNESTFKIIWSHHHILMDGWCMGVIVGEFLQIYKSYLNGNEPELGVVTPYSNYIKWLEGKDKKISSQYWNNYLADQTERSSLPSVKSNFGVDYKKKILKYTLPESVTKGIKSFARDNGLTPNIVFQACWGILLNKYNYSNSSVFGAVVSGRPAEIPNVSSIIGLFINTIPVKVNCDEYATFLEIAKQLQLNASNSMAHEHFSLAEITEQSPLKKDLFDHILIYENFPVSMDLENLDSKEFGFTISDLNTFEQTNYDLNVIFFPKGEEIFIKYDFNESRYAENFIAEIHERYVLILQQAISQHNLKFEEFSLLNSDETDLLFKKLKTDVIPQPERTVVELIEKQVGQFSNLTAIEFNGNQVTYAQLNTKANALAKVLMEKHQVKKGDFVALLADRSENSLISILGILKTGAAYIPIDTSNPTERIAYMLEDSNAKLLITDSKEHFETAVFDISVINELDELSENINHSSLSGLAYIIYTSGSTGMPKGCKLTHANLVSYIYWANDYYFSASQAEGNSCLFTSLSFDLTITSIFSPLTRGKKLTVYPQGMDVKDILLDAFSSANEIDFLKITPAHATLLPHLGIQNSNVKAVIVGGEELKREHINNLLTLNPKIIIFNEYGPTETTVGCSVKKIVHGTKEITIGKPSGNAAMLVADKGLNPLPVGAYGELLIAGNGVGVGYHNKAELTSEKFVNEKNVNFYRTGDLGYYLSNGELQFAGRIDSQTKVRGYRIETGEIEYHLLKTGFIKQCFVTAVSDMLCAYIVTENEIEKENINAILRKSLPDYMLPDMYISLDEIPLTSNGKVDKKALPDPATKQAQTYLAPQTETEQKLAEIWKQVLGATQIGLNDNFFELGGHSLKTTILSSQILKIFEKEIKLKQIFAHPVLKDQAELIDKNEIGDGIQLEVVAEKDYYDLSYSQKQIWVVQQIDPNSVAYIIPATRKLKGNLDVNAFRKAFDILILRHDSLRCNFISTDGEPKMVVHQTASFSVQMEDLSGRTNRDELIRELDFVNATSPFDLENDSLLRVKLVKSDEHEHILLFAMHHIISDGWSMDVIISEIAQLYSAYTKEKENPLSPLTFQYKDYLAWEEKMLLGDRFEQQKKFWSNHFEGGIKAIHLPFDTPKSVQTFNGKTQLFYFSKEQQQKVSELARQYGVTLNVFLLAVYNVFLTKISKQKEITVRSITTGRNHSDLQNMIGYFVRVFGIKNKPLPELKFADFLKDVNQRFIDVMDNDLYPYELVMQDMNAGKDNSNTINVDYFYQNLATVTISDKKEMDGISVEAMSIESLIARNDLLLTVNEEVDNLIFSFNYNSDLFTDETADSMVTWFKHLLNEVIENPRKEICGYRLGNSVEHQSNSEELILSDNEMDLISRFCSKLNIDPVLYFKVLYAYLIRVYTNSEDKFEIRDYSNSQPSVFGVDPTLFTLENSELFTELCNQNRDSSAAINSSNSTYCFEWNSLSDRFYGEDDVVLKITQNQSSAQLKFIFPKQSFTGKNTLKRLAHLSNQLCSTDITFDKLQLLLSEEMKDITPFTASKFPSEKTIHQLFEEQTALTPNAVALQFGEDSMTYRQLNERSNQLAHSLLEKGIQKEDIVPIMVDRSFEMVIGLFGIMKAGAAYLPIDPELPKERIAYMLEDSNAKLLLTHSSMQIVGFTNEILHLDQPETYHVNCNNPHVGVQPDNLVYVIYTSGSTGLPKGTMLQHTGVVNRIYWMFKKFNFTSDDVVIQKTTYSFDVSVWEFFTTLCFGSKLVLCKKDVIYDPEKLIQFIEKYGITSMHFVPSMFNVFLAHLNEGNKHKIQSLRQIFASGEALSLEAVKKHYKYIDAELHNMYGPTEASVEVSAYFTKTNDTEVPIGKPIDNIQLYILDKNLNQLPPGVPGELHIAGVGVARGYLNREDLTNEKFISNPYGTGKLYKTGDLCKWREDGNILYLGRIDQQVKIRGYRIELGEIEAQLRAIETIRDAAVITREVNSDQVICAYYVSDKKLDADLLLSALKKTMPDYMLPSFIIRIDSIPLSPNGKLDRKSLPEPEISEIKSGTSPKSIEAILLAEIWKDVLSVEPVFLESNFFELGGHSLRAALLVARIEKSFHVKIPLAEIFKNRTLVQQLELIQKSGKTESYEIAKAPTLNAYPLSKAQRRLFFLDKMEGVQTTYHLPSVFEVTGKLDVIRLENAVHQLIERHSILRTSFHLEQHEPVQVIHEKGIFNLEHIRNNKSVELATKSFIRPFDLEKPTQMRLGILSEGLEKHYLLFDMHHIITDGTSMGILVRELIAYYHDKSLEAFKIEYKDFAYFQHSNEYRVRLEEHESHWFSTFSDEIPLLDLPTDFPRPASQRFEGENFTFELTETQKNRLNELAKKNNSTLFMVLLGMYHILLSKYTGQNDIVIGTPVAGRTYADLQQQIGMFVNTLPLRNDLQSNSGFADFLQVIKNNTLQAIDHQDYPFEQIIDKLNVSRTVNRNPLFDTMFMLQNTESETIEIEGLTFKPYPFENKTAKFDLTLQASENETGIHLNFEYSSNLFKKETIERMSTHLIRLIDTICKDGDQKIAEISLLGQKESNTLLIDFNQTKVSYPERTILELFEDQVRKNPTSIALRFEDKTFNYQELNASANQVASYLIHNKLEKEQIVALYMERSEKVIAALLGVMKAGGAYLPIDKSLPENRVQYMLEDSGAKFVFADSELSSKNVQVFNTKDNWGEISSFEDVDLKISIQWDQLAYIIYTSGSTGLPKGCKISHKNLFNYISWANETYFTEDSGNFGLYTSLSFDLTVTSIYCSLTRGKELFIYPPMEVHEILEHSFRKESKIDSVKITPAHITLLQQLAINETNVSTAIVGGEALNNAQVKILREINPQIRIFNEYGPTETTVGCIVKEISSKDDKILIGKPIANTSIYILDEYKNLLPQGVCGEIWIGGAGVGLGYMNKPEMTLDRFVDNPFGDGKIYKTGDSARWTVDGEIDYIGRKDEQVKIRGYRIELGEIENQIRKIEGIKDVVVIDRVDSNNDKYLCAYLVGNVNRDSIIVTLSNDLPEYMIPSFFVELDAIPLTVNGKTDRKALPEPVRETSIEDYQAPATSEEIVLSEIWQKLLNVNRVSTNDDFFALGGDSIKAIQLTSRLRAYGYGLQIKDIFEKSKLSDLAKRVVKSEIQIDQSEVNGFASPTAIQTAFLEDTGVSKNHYNQSVMLFNENGFDEKIIGEIFKNLLKHHDGLRMFVQNNQLFNASFADIQFKIETYANLSGKEIETKAQELQKGFDIEKAPLVKVALFKTSEGDHLLIIIHHLIVDGISWRVLLDDFQSIYSNLNEGKEIELPQKTNSFLQWAKEINELAGSNEFLKKQTYWVNDTFSEVPALFAEKSNDRGTSRYKINFDETLTSSLISKVNQAFNTDTNDILLSALSLAIKKIFGTDRFLVSLEGHGRENLLPHLDISRTVGWFTSMYPVLLEHRNDNLDLHIIRTKENLREIPQKGVGFGILKHLTPNTKKTGFNDAIQPQILFNFLGDFDNSLTSENFSISHLSTGENMEIFERKFALEINGLIAGQKLSFDLDFVNAYLTETEQKQFVELFKFSVKEIIEYCSNRTVPVKTPSDFNLKDVSHAELLSIFKNSETEIEKIYPLSPMQQGMLFHNLMDEVDEAYFEQTIITMSGDVNLKFFEKAFNQVVERHEILRSNIIYRELLRPHQVIYKEKFAGVHFENLSALSSNEQQRRIDDFLTNEKQQGINLSKDLLMKVSLFKVKEDQFKVIWTHHHIVIDGWCLGIIFKDFFSIYNTLFSGKAPELPAVQPYSEYIKWIENQDKGAAVDYWSSLLEDVESTVEIPGKIKTLQTDFIQGNSSFKLSNETNEKLQLLSAKWKVTPYTILQTIWGIQLQKYNSAETVTFGSVVSGRPPEINGVEDMVGLFINTIPVKVGREATFSKTARVLQNRNTASSRYEYLPLSEISALSPLKNELVNHLMIYENYPLDQQAEKLIDNENALKIAKFETFERTNYDFTITILPTDTLTISFDYNRNAYDEKWIETIRENFETILNQVVENPDLEMKAIQLLSESEQAKLIQNTKADKRENPDISVAELFKNTAIKFPQNTALCYGERTMSYAELDKASDHIAAYLKKSGVQTNDIVGIYATPSFDMVVALFGILKSGAAYLPIDVNYPSDRIAYMLEDSKAKFVLSNSDLLLAEDRIILGIKEILETEIDSNEFKISSAKNDLAYVIYTSGSTGLPKGVLVSQSNFTDYILTIKDMIGINETDRVLQHASIAFDTTIEEIYPTLCSGGALYLPNDSKNFEEIVENITSKGITIFCTSPLVLNYLNEEAKSLGKLRLITVGGDELKSKYVNKILDKVEIWNGYGPTESTVCATYYKILGNEDQMPIGKPFTNRTSYILNHDGNLLPHGLKGELCVGGSGIAIGYLNRPELTQEKFVSCTFEKGKIYKTGDLCSWDANGNILFHGRIDNQVKIRGFRIELGEIETRLLQYPNVGEAAVLAWDDEENSKYLCAYFSGNANEEELRAFLAVELPDYMVPSYFVYVEKLPLTINGKTDRKALQRPDVTEIAVANFVAPENEIQETLAKVWSEILNVKVGIDNNFFSLGGDSIKAIQLVSRIQKYNLKFDVKDLFKNPTIRQLEPFVKNLELRISQDSETGAVELIPIQKAFLAENLAYAHHYNQSIILFTPEKLNVGNLENALVQLAIHHDALRMIFKDDQLVYQSVNNFDFKLELVESNDPVFVKNHIQQTQESFSFERGNLFKAVLYRMEDGDHLFLVNHHLVVDGISWRIILEDLQQLINGEISLASKTHSFKVWSQQLIEYAQSDKLLLEKAYWEGIEEKGSDSEFVPNLYESNVRTSIELDEGETENLLKNVNTTYNTEINDILLAALVNSLYKWENRGEHVVFLEGHGREELFEEIAISRTVGWFTSMYPIVLKQEDEVSTLIKSVKENLRKVPNKGIGYGVLRYLSGKTDFKLKPQISFNYLGQFDNTFSKSKFKFSPLGTGYDVSLKNQKETLLDVSGMVVNGRLKMDFMYNPELNSPEQIEALKQAYKENLQVIIDHCLNKEESEMTVSDFDSKDLSEEELDDIMDMFDDL